jgi:hypothetical protein
MQQGNNYLNVRFGSEAAGSLRFNDSIAWGLLPAIIGRSGGVINEAD